jgi:FkbM family methyltransferase
MWQRLVLRVIRAGRRLLKNTRLERSRIVIRVYGAIFRLGFGRTDRAEIVYRGCRFVIPARDPTIVPGMLNGTYERHEIDFFETTLRAGMTVLDVGAHIGLYTVIGARRVGSAGRVVAFEPVPPTVGFLRENVDRNGAGNVTIVPKAVGARASRTRINWDPDRLGGSSSFTSGTQHVDVEIVSIDEFCATADVVPDLVKIDVEGGELDVLTGMRQTLRRGPVVMMEMNIPLLESLGRSPGEFLSTVLGRFRSVRFIDEATGQLRTLARLDDVGRQIIANLVLWDAVDDHA